MDFNMIRFFAAISAFFDDDSHWTNEENFFTTLIVIQLTVWSPKSAANTTIDAEILVARFYAER